MGSAVPSEHYMLTGNGAFYISELIDRVADRDLLADRFAHAA